MLQRHFHGTSARVGVGANRAATAASFLKQHDSNTIGVAILDDGMQVNFFYFFLYKPHGLIPFCFVFGFLLVNSSIFNIYFMIIYQICLLYTFL